ncbi:MAG: hypothetical protein PVSMB5_36960 [Ktedonobacteraceae bacterium]
MHQFTCRPAIQLHAAQHGAHAGRHLTNAKRLAHIVVGPDFEAQDTVYLLCTCCEHNDWDQVILPDAPAYREAIQLRQHPIQDDQVKRLLFNECQRGLAIKGLKYRVPFRLQLAADQIAYIYLIVYDENIGHSRVLLSFLSVLYSDHVE